MNIKINESILYSITYIILIKRKEWLLNNESELIEPALYWKFSLVNNVLAVISLALSNCFSLDMLSIFVKWSSALFQPVSYWLSFRFYWNWWILCFKRRAISIYVFCSWIFYSTICWYYIHCFTFYRFYIHIIC